MPLGTRQEHCFPAAHKIKVQEQEILACTLLSRLHTGEIEERSQGRLHKVQGSAHRYTTGQAREAKI